MKGYVIRARHSGLVRLTAVLFGIGLLVGFCDDPYSPDRWLPGD
jgi:hypothetical protein